MAIRFVVFLLAGVLLCAFAEAATVSHLDVKYEHHRYRVVIDAHIDAPPAAVHHVLLDYRDDGYTRISPVYQASGYLPPASDGTPIVYTRMKGCVLFFCRQIKSVQRLETVRPALIRTKGVPGKGDFSYVRSEVHLSAQAGGTDLEYRVVAQPNFWIPPFIGPAIIRKALQDHGVSAVMRIEHLARKFNHERATATGAPVTAAAAAAH